MKYLITVSQYGAARAGLLGKVDLVDLAIFDAFKDFANSERIQKIHRHGHTWFWIDYKLIIAELPFLDISTSDAVYRRMKKLAAAEVIVFCPDNQQLGRSYFRWGPVYDILISSSAIPLRMENRRGTDQTPEGYGSNAGGRPDEKPDDQKTIDQGTNPVTNPPEPQAAVEGKKERIQRQSIEALQYLNLICGREFHLTRENLKFAAGRLNGLATLDDLKLIVEHKAFQWQNTDRAQYLRPATLFQAEKIDAYLQAAKAWKNGANGTQTGIAAARASGIYSQPNPDQ